MADPVDVAQSEEQIFLISALSKRSPSLAYKEICHWCDEPVAANTHFCDADCQHDHTQHKKLNGGW